MSYVDFDATLARGNWTSPAGELPSMIPPEHESKTDDELLALGWLNVEIPTDTVNIYFYEWNTETRSYDKTERDDETKQINVEYRKFWNSLYGSNVYTTLKTAASNSLAANTVLTEFTALISDAKAGHPEVEAIQASITEILSSVTLTTDELAELDTMFHNSGMKGVYTLS